MEINGSHIVKKRSNATAAATTRVIQEKALENPFDRKDPNPVVISHPAKKGKLAKLRTQWGSVICSLLIPH
ncbi:MAG: hypothetical protein LPK26_16035 [Bacillaceae bacterium]|nr:hypothetical protein [Bacillaceae bacterium]